MLAQEPIREFGKVSREELQMTSYARDPQAEAVVLFDIGETRFVDSPNGYDIQFTRTRRVKIFSMAGAPYAEVKVMLYHDNSSRFESLGSLEAVSYNLVNGRVETTLLDQKNIYVEKVNNNWDLKKFVVPGVRAGSVIEFRYSLNTPFHFNLPRWLFQDGIPVIYSKYVVRMIPFYEYKFILQGISKFSQYTAVRDYVDREFGSVAEVYGQNVGTGTKFQDMIHTYIMKDVPAFRDESYITSVGDYIMKITFQLTKFYSPRGGMTDVVSTWPLLIQDLLKDDDFGKYIKSSDRQAKSILESEIRIGIINESERCKAIINYVKTKYRWNGLTGVYARSSIKDIVNKKEGSVSEINLLLVSLLNAAGYDAVPVLLSTRDHGKIYAGYPFLDFFNYVTVLVKAGNRTFLADGSDPDTPYNRIPPKCINEKGLLIDKSGENWINLDMNYNSVDMKEITVDVDPVTLKIDANLVVQSLEYDAYSYRKGLNNDTAKIKKYFTGEGLKDIRALRTLNYDKTEAPYIISFHCSSDAERFEDKIVISPFLNLVPSANDLTQPTRSYPVDMIYASSSSFRTRIKIPDGYRVMTLPEPQKTDNDLVEISLEFSEEPGIVIATGSFRYKKAVYQPTEYTRLKAFKGIIIRKFNAPLVLVKS